MEEAIYNFINTTFGAMNDVCGSILYLSTPEGIPITFLGVPLSTFLLGLIALVTLIRTLIDIVED